MKIFKFQKYENNWKFYHHKKVEFFEKRFTYLKFEVGILQLGNPNIRLHLPVHVTKNCCIIGCQTWMKWNKIFYRLFHAGVSFWIVVWLFSFNAVFAFDAALGRSTAIMSTAVLAVVAVILCILFRILNVSSQPQKPSIWCSDNEFLDMVLKIAPLLQEP